MGFEAGKPTNVKVRVPRKKKATKVKAPPAPQVHVHVHVNPTPDAMDRTRGVAPDQQAKTEERAAKQDRRSPDAKDVTARSPAQKRHDAQVVAENVASSRRAAVVARRQARVKAVVTGRAPRGATSRPGDVIYHDFRGDQAAAKREQVAKLAPVLKVLDQTTRVNHAIAGAADAALTHKPVLKAAQRGIENKDRTTFSDVLGHAGVKNKAIKAIVGTGLDIGLDPTTYVTGGTGSVAAKAAEKAGANATAKATAKGLTEGQAKKFGERAATQAAKTADRTTGATVKVAGKEVPGVRKATAVASKPVRKAAKVVPQKVRTAVRNVGADVNPDITPTGVTKETSQKATQATRTARAKTNQGNREGINIAHGIRSQIGEANYAKVIDAVERGKIKSLPDELHGPAVRLRDAMRYANRQRKHAGVKGGEIKSRPQIKVPPVTADVGASAKAVGKARRAEASAQRALDHAHSQADVHQGRAEVLSRNVSGSKAEQAAMRGRKRKVRPTTEPGPVRPGYVRLYRGQRVVQNSGGPDWADAPEGVGSSRGRWFTDNPDRAHGYANGGMGLPGYVSYVDVPEAVAKSVYHGVSQNGATYVLPNKVARLAREHVPGSRAAAIAEHKSQQESSGQAAEISYKRRVARAKVLGHEPPPKPEPRPPAKPSRLLSPHYAGGAHGVTTTRTAVQDAEQHLQHATAARVATEASHEATKASRAAQQKAAGHAVKVNAKRAQAPKSYLPHPLTEQGIEETGHTAPTSTYAAASAGGKRAVRPTSSRGRAVGRNIPLSELHTKFPGQYRTDLHATAGERVAQGHASAAQAELNRRLADLGRTVRKGSSIGKDEHVWHIKGSNIREVTDSAEKQAIVDTGHGLGSAGNGGRFVSLPKDVVERAQEGMSPKLPGSDKGIVRGIDKTTAGFKRIALGTVGFHVRNFVGDTSQAYVHQPGQKLAGNLARAKRVTKTLNNQERAARELGRPAPSGKTLKTGKYGHVSYEDIAHNLVHAGAARSGYTARELRELSDSGGKAGAKVLRPFKKAGQTKTATAGKRALLNREDIPRLATAIHALRNGATWEQAAQKVADVHIDYGHLTNFERKYARRIMPFYTWTARNIPIQTKALVRNPGKFAAYQKVREEATKASQPGQVDQQTKDLYAQLEAAGVKLPGGWERYLSSYEQRNAGIPTSWKGHKFTVSAGLPLADLNELPGAAGKGQAQEYFNKAMSLMNPIGKNPVEYFSNFSFFFRDQIERDTSPYVSAPGAVGKLPDSLKRDLGIVKKLDKQSGKMVWQWRGKTDYLASQLPGIPNLAKQLSTPGHGRNGKGLGGKLLAGIGIKSAPVDPTTNAINLAYQRQADIQKELAGLRGQKNPANGAPISAKNPTPQYTKLNAQLKITTQIAFQGKSARGDAVLPPQGGPPKTRGSSDRVQVPGLTARVRVPGATGRVRIP